MSQTDSFSLYVVHVITMCEWSRLCRAGRYASDEQRATCPNCTETFAVGYVMTCVVSFLMQHVVICVPFAPVAVLIPRLLCRRACVRCSKSTSERGGARAASGRPPERRTRVVARARHRATARTPRAGPHARHPTAAK